MTRRPHVSLKTKLASALLVVGAIPHNDAKAMTADQILSLFHWDHWPIPKAHGGTDAPHNLMPRYIGAHRAKTAKIDQPMLAKVRALTRDQEDFRRRVLERSCGEKREPTGRWPKRKMRGR